MLAVFTPKRRELIAKLCEIGPVTTAQLARTLERDYKNVHADVAALSEWLAFSATIAVDSIGTLWHWQSPS